MTYKRFGLPLGRATRWIELRWSFYWARRKPGNWNRIADRARHLLQSKELREDSTRKTTKIKAGRLRIHATDTCVEKLGTSNGISSIWFALALRKTGGQLITHEIDPDTAAPARKNFETARVSDLITVVEGNAHETVTQQKSPIDVVFIDADKSG
jgi:predicted O-methyltransferase YrrM